MEKERGDQRWKSYSTTSTTYYVLLLPTSKLHLKSWEKKEEQGGTKGKKLDSNWEEISEGIERKLEIAALQKKNKEANVFQNKIQPTISKSHLVYHKSFSPH